MTLDFDVDRFREGVAELGDANAEAMRTIDSDIRDSITETRKAAGGASRRQFLVRAGLATTAVTIGGLTLPMGSLFTGVAAGQALTDADIAAFAASIEYAAVEAYKAAAASGKVTTKAIGDAAGAFAKEHQAHGDAFAGASGGKIAKGTANATLLKAVGDQLKAAPDEKAVVKIAFDVENAAAATYQFGLGALQSVEAKKLAASILPIEAGHAAVLGQVLYMGDAKKDATWLPSFQNETGFIDPAKTPIK